MMKPQNLLTTITLLAAFVLYAISFWLKEIDLKEIFRNMAWGAVWSSMILRFILKWKIGDKPSSKELEQTVEKAE